LSSNCAKIVSSTFANRAQDPERNAWESSFSHSGSMDLLFKGVQDAKPGQISAPATLPPLRCANPRAESLPSKSRSCARHRATMIAASAMALDLDASSGGHSRLPVSFSTSGISAADSWKPNGADMPWSAIPSHGIKAFKKTSLAPLPPLPHQRKATGAAAWRAELERASTPTRWTGTWAVC